MSKTPANPNDVLNELNAQWGAKLQIPPLCFTEMGGSIDHWQAGESIEASFPLRLWYANPAGWLQGGILAALFDNTFGPFSFLEAKAPTTTLEMQLSYVRPATIADGPVKVSAKLLEKSKNYLIFSGDARKSDGKIVAYATTRLQIFPSKQS